MKLVLESPLSGDIARNVRYAAWCARVLTLNGYTVWASHLYAPHFLDDRVYHERERGMALTDAITNDNWAHVFALDLGESRGMHQARKHYWNRNHIALELSSGAFIADPRMQFGLAPLIGAAEAWSAFVNGVSPPCTPGFELGGGL